MHLTPPQTGQCSEVNITDDSVREGQERFSVSISSLNDAVILGSSTATVIIQDNDGKLQDLFSYLYSMC